MPIVQTRRRFLTTLSLASIAGLVSVQPSLAAEGELETTTVRIAKTPAICLAPQYISEELLRAEGFTDIRYVPTGIPALLQSVARGDTDFTAVFAPVLVAGLEQGFAISVLGPVHVGCFEVFGNEQVRSITDLN